MRYELLSNSFYQKHIGDKEILQKQGRPYYIIVLKINGLDIGIPLRSYIRHKYAYFTTPKLPNTNSRSGLDFTKAVVLDTQTDIDGKKVKINQNEYKVLLGREHRIEQGFLKFLSKYKNALKNPALPENKFIVQNSALQYFHQELNIK